MPLANNNNGLDKLLFPALPFRQFYETYSVSDLKPGLVDLLKIGHKLNKEKSGLRILGIGLYPWHNQTTLWWFEQGLLNLISASGWEIDWYTDAHFSFDERLLQQLPGQTNVYRVPNRADFKLNHRFLPKYDAVISLYPCDEATEIALKLDIPLISFSIKNLHEDLKPLTVDPPPNTPFWHAFAGSQNFINATENLMGVQHNWKLKGAPFPINRYYFPVRQKVKPEFPVMLFGSKYRNISCFFNALSQAGIDKALALVDDADVKTVDQEAKEWGISCEIQPSTHHFRVIELLENTHVVANPICPPAESHYSVSTPLALGRPIVASESPSVKPFAGSGLQMANIDHPDEWAETIQRTLDATQNNIPYPPALTQGKNKHDMSRFFASAILNTL